MARLSDTKLWLRFEVASGDHEHMSTLKFNVCEQFKNPSISMQNYNPAFSKGTANIQTSAFKENACAEMSIHAMALYKKQHSGNICECKSITKG